MKNNVKEIITEAVLEFLNKEARGEKPEDKFELPIEDPEDVSAHYWEVPIKHKAAKQKKPVIHPSFQKPPSTQLSPPGVNEEQLSEEEKRWYEKLKKRVQHKQQR